MTLPPAPDKPIFRIHNTPKEIIKDVFVEYTKANIGIALWSEEFEMNLVYGTLRPFDEQEAINKICTEYGISIQASVSQVLRGTKLTIQIILDGSERSNQD